jgi:hypothetical protein
MKIHSFHDCLLFCALLALNVNPVQALPTPYQQAILNDAPVAFWPLNEGNTITPAYPNNGVIAVDIVGGKNGFYTNSDIGLPGFSAFDTNTAAGFGTDGFHSAITTNSFVANIPTTTGTPSLNFYSPSGTATNFTVEAWVCAHGTSQGSGAPILACGGPTNGQNAYFIDCGSSQDLRFYTFNASGNGSSTAAADNGLFNTSIPALANPPSGIWWHVVGVYNGTLNTNLLYVNGVQVGGGNPSGTQGIHATAGAPITFGSRQVSTSGNAGAYTLQYNGSLQNLAVYGKALTAQQVVNHYFARPAAPQVSLAGGFFADVSQPVTVTAYLTNGTPSYNYIWYYSKTGTDSNYLSSGVITTPGATPVFNATVAATPVTLTLPNPQPAQVGYTYYLYVTNAYGASRNGSVLTNVYVTPAIQSFTPNGNTLYTGRGQTFTVAAAGESPLFYQWFTNYNGGAFAATGASSATATNYATATNLAAGTYHVYVLVTNLAGAAYSTTNSMIFVVPTNSYPLAVLADRPVAFWPLNEGNPPARDNYPNDGLAAFDYVGGYNGHYTNADIGEPGYDPLDPNTAAQFQTSGNGNSYVAGIPGTTGLDFGTNSGNAVNFSVEAWVSGNGNAANNDGNAIFDAGLTSFDLDVYEGVYRFYYFPPTGGSINVQGGTGVAGNVFANGWNHVVGVVDETHGYQYLYVNGVVVASQTINISGGLAAPLASQPITIGARPATAGGPYTRQYNGYVQNVAIYNYALSGQQVTNHYYAAPAPPTIAMASSFTAYQGQNSTFQATFTGGTPPISYVWYYSVNGTGSNYLTSGISTSSGGTASLTLTNAQLSQAGYTYSIYATNAFGHATASAVLQVSVAPAFSGLTPGQSIIYGATNLVLSGKLSASGPIYPARGETVTVTINSNSQTAAINDSTGDFSLNYNPSTIPVSGTPYTITYLYAGDAALSGCSDTSTALLVSQTAQNVSPVILKTSDGVAPGGTFSINGQWLFPTITTVAMAADTTGQSPGAPPANAIYPQIVQTDVNGHYIFARMPSGTLPGVYDVWVNNQLSPGWSRCYKLNAARALFMSDYQAYNGTAIEVVGRNFDQKEFGGATATQVRLNNGQGATYNQLINDLNPYHLTFTVGNLPLGSYYVEVSSDNGLNWSRVASGQTLTVLAVPSGQFDPLGLGVSWAANYNWTNVFNVTNYGVIPNSPNNQNVAVQTVMNAVENSGGGVVYFPNGSYYLGGYLALGAGVVLEGQDEYNTQIYFATGTGSSFIKSKGTAAVGGIAQLQGVARMSILLSNPTNLTVRPDIFLYLGDTGGGAVPTANRMFVASVNLSYPYTNGNLGGAGPRGIGISWGGKERVLLKDNQFTGWEANNADTSVGQYCMIRNNRYEYATGYVNDNATYMFFENNYIKVHSEYDADCHGYDARTDAYMAGNYIEGAGDQSNVNNDGEALFVEGPGGTFNYGAVLSATTNSITVAPLVPLFQPAVSFGVLSVNITWGTGLGQSLPVASVNTNTDVITFTQPFAVVPDATSIFSLCCPLAEFTVYSNTVVNCAKGIWPYGLQYDGVVANNTAVDCDGVYLHSSRKGPPADPTAAQDGGDYFERITRNTVVGVSRRSNQAGVGFGTGRSDSPNFYDITVYATEITGNLVFGNGTVAGGGTEAPSVSGIYAYAYPGSMSNGVGDDTAGTLIESNVLSDLQGGVTLTQCNYGQLVNANTYDGSVLDFLNNFTGSADNTLVTSNILQYGAVAPSISLQPRSQSVLVSGAPTFYVLPGASLPAPSYQWFMNGVAIPGATGASYTVPPVALSANGAVFSVILSNSVGSVVSSNALLTVGAWPVAPVITSQPVNQAVSVGCSSTFTVSAASIPAPSYQWQTNGVNIPGACASSYTTPILSATNNGTSYSCIVANGAGSTNSMPALLQVTDATPSMTYGTMAGGAQLQLLLQGAPNRTYDVQVCTNLTSGVWTLLASITLTNTAEYVADLTGSNLPMRFYRAVLLP